MKKVKLHAFLKCLSAVGVFCGVYPAVMVLRELVRPSQSGVGLAQLLPDMLFFAAAYALGVLSSSLLIAHPGFFRHPAGFLAGKRGDPVHAALRLATVCCFLLVIPVLGLTRFYYMQNDVPGSWHYRFECIAMLPVFTIAVRCGKHSYDSLLNYAYVVFGAMCLVLSAFLNWVASGGNLHYIYPVFMGIFLFTAMLASNQSGLERYVSSKRHMEMLLPKNVRRRGVISVLAVFIIIMSLLFLYRPIAAAFVFAARMIFSAFLLLLRLFNLLFSFLETESVFDDSESGLPPESMAAGDGNPVADAIFLVLFIALIAFALYKLLPKLWPALRRLLHKLYETVRTLASRLIHLRRRTPVTYGDYHDEIEIIEPEPYALKKTKRKRLLRVSEVNRITDPAMRMRYTYRLALLALKRRLPLKPPDTTGEICRAAEREFRLQQQQRITVQLDSLTAQYEEVRYKGTLPDEAALEDARQKMVFINKKIKPAVAGRPLKHEKKIKRIKNNYF